MDAVVVEVPAALGEAVQEDFDQTLVPGWTHGQETVLQRHITHTVITTNRVSFDFSLIFKYYKKLLFSE